MIKEKNKMLKEIESQLVEAWPQQTYKNSDIKFLIDRVKRLTEALEFCKEETSDGFIQDKARKALEGEE